MKTYLKLLSLVLMLMLLSCGAEHRLENRAQKSAPGQLGAPAGEAELPSILQKLDELAELERTGTWLQGMALTESSLRENAGDYAGAVTAAYKELARAYGMGSIQKSDLDRGLLNVLAVQGEEIVTKTANAIIAFSNGRWDEAAAGLKPIFNELDEPDGFGRWMILVCALEKNPHDRQAAAAYRSIRARYAQFPEYWYRGARAFSGAIAAEFAENCINSSPQGPFAQESRKILASYTGLRIEDGVSLLTKREIESIISQSVNSNNPQILDSLLPLIGLPDNPYTVYAVGALRSLSNVPAFRDYFNRQASFARGRLAERLIFIGRS
ncbi:MAG: hypothetical protein FWC01_01095 [Treponema sp.]|nr:hypothetical protein [Treponema sp.]MCL2236792.1 hypothetical protein [Treponema sp.]